MRRIFLALVLLIFSGNITQANEVGTYPNLIAKTFDHKVFSLADNRGKVVIVNFWAKWCKTCRKELPVLNELYQKYHAQGLEIISINIDSENKLSEVLEITSTLSYTNATFYKTNSSFTKPNSIPVNFIIDKSGKITAKIKGLKSKQDFENIIKSQL